MSDWKKIDKKIEENKYIDFALSVSFLTMLIAVYVFVDHIGSKM